MNPGRQTLVFASNPQEDRRRIIRGRSPLGTAESKSIFNKALRPFRTLPQILRIAADDKCCDRNCNDDGDKKIHSIHSDSHKSQQHRHPNVGERQNSEGVAKRLVHDVPQFEHLLGMRKKQYAPGKHCLLTG